MNIVIKVWTGQSAVVTERSLYFLRRPPSWWLLDLLLGETEWKYHLTCTIGVPVEICTGSDCHCTRFLLLASTALRNMRHSKQPVQSWNGPKCFFDTSTELFTLSLWVGSIRYMHGKKETSPVVWSARIIIVFCYIASAKGACCLRLFFAHDTRTPPGIFHKH
jgi:hypothetical protein